MAVLLEIEDGNPWYLSPNVQVVSVDDPEIEIVPTAGVPYYLKATVRNIGQTGVENATVRFYWANPAVGFDRTTANAIGTAFVSLEPSQTDNVLCLTPWIPMFVNQGHECILAEVFHPSLDPLPSTSVFNVPTDRHVAQRNLSVALALRQVFHFSFEIHNPQRKPQLFSITAEQVNIKEAGKFLKLLGQKYNISANDEGIEVMGFTSSICPDDKELNNLEPRLKQVEIAPGGRMGMTLAGKLSGNSAFVLVKQETNGQIVGGLGVLIVQNKEKE